MFVNIKNYEMNKPSEFCQVLYFENYDKTIFAELSPTQIDLMNVIVYKTREIILKNKIEIDFDQISHMVEIDLMEISGMLNKYNHQNYDALLSQLNGLRKLDIIINVLLKNKDLETTLTSFIHELVISRHQSHTKKKVKVHISTKVLKFFLHTKKLFTKFFLTIQFSMNSKYSKLLYEVLKDYEGIKSKTIDYELLIGLLNALGNTRVNKFSYFNNDILKKSIKEINEKSDISVDYEPIKEKLDGRRKQVTKIKFNIKKQPESRLEELGLIETSITANRFYNKSKTKLDKLVKNKYHVVDEEMWITTDIKKNEERYDAEVRIDKWLLETDKNDQNELFEKLVGRLDNCEDPIVSIEDYKIIGVFSKDSFTRNPSETIKLLNETIKEM